MMIEVKSITEGQYRNQVVQYDPSTILELCNRLSAKLVRERKTMISGTWTSRIGGFAHDKVFHVTHHKIALLAMIALQNYRYAHGKTPSEKEFIALTNNVSTIHNPVDGIKPSDPKESLFSIMIRLAYQQFPFQETIHNVLPRHLLLYLYSKVKQPVIALDREAYNAFGLSIQEYMTIGLLFYAMALQNSAFPRSFWENTPIASTKKYLTSEKVERFLARACTDFNTFRNLCMQEINDYPNGGTYRFNPLFDRPIILRKDGRLCAPVPILIPYTVTKGLYYDFLNLFSSKTGNPFAEWFGYAFELYGGMLLKKVFGKQNVFPEPVYDKEHKRGPDWIVIQGNSAIVLEFRSGRLNKKAKISGDYSDVAALVNRNIIDPILKFPEKIKDIKSGLTPIPSNGSMEFFPCIVTYEPLYPNQMFREIVQRELRLKGIQEYEFELMSIEDLEWLLSWAMYENPVDFLRSKRGNPEWKNIDVSHLVEIRMKERGIASLRNPLLDKVFDRFWRQTVPELSQSAETQ